MLFRLLKTSFLSLSIGQIYKFFVELIPARDHDDDNDDDDEAAVPEDQEEDKMLRPQVRVLPPHLHDIPRTGSMKPKVFVYKQQQKGCEFQYIISVYC